MKTFLGRCVVALLITAILGLVAFFLSVKFGWNISILLGISLFFSTLLCLIELSIVERRSYRNFAAFKQEELEKKLVELFWDFAGPEMREKWFLEVSESSELQQKRKDLQDAIRYWSERENM